jgi:hypothetical protein
LIFEKIEAACLLSVLFNKESGSDELFKTFDEIKNLLFDLEIKYLIDPPSGWMYGFPKKIPKERLDKDPLVFLVENGYPQEEINNLGEHFYYKITEVKL